MAIFLACLAAFAFGALAVAIRIGYRRHADPTLAPFVISLSGLLLVALVTGLSGGFDGSSGGELWPFVLIGAVVPGASQLLFVRAIRDAGPSRASVVIGVAPLISAALAVAFLDEPLRPALGVATLLVVAGGMLLGWERTRPVGFRLAGLVFALLCAVLFALRDNFVRLVERESEISALAATVASLGGATLALALVLLLQRPDLSRAVLRNAFIAFLPAGLSLGVAYAALLEAFDRGRVTLVAPLNATQSLWAVVLSAALLHRTESIGPRMAAAAILVVAGGVLVGVTR
jgi:drug/metabolite transporter (DMT)-like permease